MQEVLSVAFFFQIGISVIFEVRYALLQRTLQFSEKSNRSLRKHLGILSKSFDFQLGCVTPYKSVRERRGDVSRALPAIAV
ncbi:MAG: hypothetical protein KAF91_17820 [Nostoc sp. TH1S01]|nr:hypothetical protein [Nostoc sp. TH1S01]